MNRSTRLRLIGIASAGLAVATALPASATVGDLTPKGCIAEADNGSPLTCATFAHGLTGVRDSVVSPDGKRMYTIGGNTTIGEFKRDVTTGALTELGCVHERNLTEEGCATSARGLLGTLGGIAISPDGSNVYVVTATPAVVVFSRGAAGALHPMGCISDVNNADGCAATTDLLAGSAGLTAVAVSPDGRSVYVGAQHALVRFDRDTTTGDLTAHGCVEQPGDSTMNCKTSEYGVPITTTIIVSPDGKLVYTLAAGNGTGYNTIDTFARGPLGALTPIGCLVSETYNSSGGCLNTSPLLGVLSHLAIAPDGNWLYATDYTPMVVRLVPDATNGVAVRGCIGQAGGPCARTAAVMGSPISIGVSSDGRSVYVTDTGERAVLRFTRSQTTGLLSDGGCVSNVDAKDWCGTHMKALYDPQSVVLSPDGSSVYVADAYESAIAMLARAAA